MVRGEVLCADTLQMAYELTVSFLWSLHWSPYTSVAWLVVADPVSSPIATKRGRDE